MQRDTIFNVCFLLFTLLTFIAGCTKAPVMMEQPIQVTSTPIEKIAQPQFPVKRGALVIMSEPMGANVKVDDNPVETTPLVLKDIPAGSYRIEIVLEHYVTYQGEVDVKHQQMAEVRVKLKPKLDTLEIKSQPDSEKMQIDGNDEGVTPYSKWMPSNVVRSITVSAEGYYPEIPKTTVQLEGKEMVSIILEKIPTWSMEIKSDPTGTSIWIDGKNVGAMPHKVTSTVDGEHEIILSENGHDLKSLTIKPEEKQSTSVKGDESLPNIQDKVADKPESIIREKDGAIMMFIPAGEFQMGSSESEGDNDEHPQHIVFLDAFYIDRYEVTNAQYKQFLDATGRKAPNYWDDPKYNAPNQPVVGVTWDDANAYAEWTSARLPTEAEWEKSAKGGLVGKKYPWGDDITHDNANYYGTGGKDIWDGPAPVGSFEPNGYGLYDMAGNVWEWCKDWYGSNYYVNSPKSNPTGPSAESDKVLRGSSWYDHGNYDLRIADRNFDNPSYYDEAVGFRCAQ